MKKIAFLSLVLLSSLACATISKTFEPTQPPTLEVPSTPVVIATGAPQDTSAPTPINRKENVDLYCPSDIEDATNAYNQGVNYEAAGDFESAITAYRQAITLDPAYCDAMDNLAYALRQTGDVEEAITWYQASIAVAPDGDVAHLGLANAYLSIDDYDNALTEYNALLKLDANNPEGYYGAGRVYFTQEKYQDALVQFQKAEELYKAEGSDYIVDAQVYIGFCHVMLKDYEAGRDMLEQVYPQMQDNAYVNYFLGQCYYYGTSIRNDELAKKYLTRARDLGVTLEPELESFINQ